MVYFLSLTRSCAAVGADLLDRRINVLIQALIVGRTGKLHAWQWESAQPDLQVVGKALGGGYAPISAILMNKKVVDAFRKGSGAFINGAWLSSNQVSN